MGIEPSSSSRLPRSRGGAGLVPYFGRVIFIPAWFTLGGIEGLDYLSIEIGFMEYGVELWKVVHCLIGTSSHEELIQLIELLRQTSVRLTAFGVLKLTNSGESWRS
ncbi:hypothetical protein AMTR_s00009p00259910 [Amborella trichopoda]|uniref:Uncharacterized protein n=1 Tax=Amborella trichopoda TaxID=13333 RepID=W1NIS8_AMBTC|nr:hypothetical protein AMTR_s00009p00259910 [Amborella trichopoda]